MVQDAGVSQHFIDAGKSEKVLESMCKDSATTVATSELLTMQGQDIGKVSGIKPVFCRPKGNSWASCQCLMHITGTDPRYPKPKLGPNAPYWTNLLGASRSETHGGIINVDSVGNVYMTGSTSGALLEEYKQIGSRAMFLVKYDHTGKKLWVSQLGAEGGNVAGHAIGFDKESNVYVAGLSEGEIDGIKSENRENIFLVKYDKDGKKIWTRLMQGERYRSSFVNVALDPQNNVIVTGSSRSGLELKKAIRTERNAVVFKYNQDGKEIWRNTVSASESVTVAKGVYTDAKGFVYIAGSAHDAVEGNPANNKMTGIRDAFVAKFDPAGKLVWARQTGAADAYTDGFRSTVDTFGNVFLLGTTTGQIEGNKQTGSSDVVLVKFDASGKQLWARQYGVDTQAFIMGGAIAADSKGSVYVTGATTQAIADYEKVGRVDIYTIKFDAGGKQVWAVQKGFPEGESQGQGLFIDKNDNIYVTGSTKGPLDGWPISGDSRLEAVLMVNTLRED